jgi:hypothetical protein
MVAESAGSGAELTPTQTVMPAQLQDRIAVLGQQAQQIQKSASSFAAAAGTGFHIEPQAAATLINACRDGLNQLNELGNHIFTLSQTPQLGQTPGASVVAPFTQSVATDPQGIAPAIQNLQRTLQDMIQAYQKASTNYQQTSEIIEQSMRAQQNTLA